MNRCGPRGRFLPLCIFFSLHVCLLKYSRRLFTRSLFPTRKYKKSKKEEEQTATAFRFATHNFKIMAILYNTRKVSSIYVSGIYGGVQKLIMNPLLALIWSFSSFFCKEKCKSLFLKWKVCSKWKQYTKW